LMNDHLGPAEGTAELPCGRGRRGFRVDSCPSGTITITPCRVLVCIGTLWLTATVLVYLMLAPGTVLITPLALQPEPACDICDGW
jgi:hypothetical protein